MSKTLSQWEIDALLNSIGSDDGAPSGPSGSPLANVLERSIKLYDFRRPDRFSKEHIRAIQNIHETFARVTASSLSSYLRSPTTVSLSSIEQVVYDEYVHQLRVRKDTHGGSRAPDPVRREDDLLTWRPTITQPMWDVWAAP